MVFQQNLIERFLMESHEISLKAPLNYIVSFSAMLLRKIQLSSFLGQQFVRLVDPKMSFTNLSKQHNRNKTKDAKCE